MRVDGVQRVQREKVLKIDGPFRAQGFLSLTALRAEGCGIALTGDEHKVSVTGFTFSAIWHDKHSAVENHTTAPAVRGRSVFPRAKARLSRFYHKRAPSNKYKCKAPTTTLSGRAAVSRVDGIRLLCPPLTEPYVRFSRIRLLE